MKYDVNRLKTTQLKILDYIVDICGKNNINYFLYFGTLLGAIRHGGYIPWDDDLDIACVRTDYEKLIKLLEENQKSNPEFYIQSLNIDQASPVCHTKVRMNKTECIEKNSVSDEQHKGIFVDIFPLDGYKRNYRYLWKSKLIRILYSVRGDTLFPNKKRSLRSVLTFPLAHFDVEIYNNWIYKLMTSCDAEKCEYLTCYVCRYKADKCCIEKKWTTSVILKDFENSKYNVPSNYHNVLESLYGKNYMELPPEEKRTTHEYQRVSWNE